MSFGATKPARGIDLLRAVPALRWLAARRSFPSGGALVLLVLLLFLLGAGFAGTPVGNRNGLVVSVWILWWFLLIAVLLPFASRGWCAACPIPFFGDWLQRRSLLGVRVRDGAEAPGYGVMIGHNRYFGLSRRWPRALSNLWLQNAAFVLLASFSAVLLTSALATALTLTAMVVSATAVAAVFRQRTFCRFVCPVGGFLSLYSMPAPLALRAKDADACGGCRDKACVAGNERGWGCPWLVQPNRLERNSACGLCLECLKTCSRGNMSLFLRAPLLDRRLEGYDEAWKAYLMLALALAYSLVYLGPWGSLKTTANIVESGDWPSFVLYALALCGFSLLVLPGVFVATAWLGRRLASITVPTGRLALASASALVPFGLLAWIAFSVAWHFKQRGCITCHGEGARGGVPNPNSMNAQVPELATLARRTFLFTPADVTAFREVLLSGAALDRVPRTSAVPLFPTVKTQYLAFRQTVREGRRSARLRQDGPRPPLDMPAWRSRLSDDEIDQILAYLLSLSEDEGIARPSDFVHPKRRSPMKLQTPAVLSLAVLTLGGSLAACSGPNGSAPSMAMRHQGHGRHSSNTTETSVRTEPSLFDRAMDAASADTGSRDFTGSLDEIKRFIGYYHSMQLTPEQERLKVEALSAMSAPCCKKYSLATCCCPCNMAKAAWGLAAQLITEKGYKAEQIRQAETAWLKKVNPAGFSGDSCFTGGCTRPMRANGCGGMKEDNVAF